MSSDCYNNRCGGGCCGGSPNPFQDATPSYMTNNSMGGGYDTTSATYISGNEEEWQ